MEVGYGGTWLDIGVCYFLELKVDRGGYRVNDVRVKMVRFCR